MHRLWEVIIRPIIEILQPESVVEIGAAKGVNTYNLLRFCKKHGGILHSIDPNPDFDVEAYKEEFQENFIFHSDLSLNALSQIDRFDIVLIDGDHNWYTVFNELKLIEKYSNDLSQDFPFIILHDIGWPYGKRDLYYNPENIPSDFLNPYSKKGISLESNELEEGGGLNKHLYNAVSRSDEKNGVLTAIEDFLKQTDLLLEFKKVPGMFGLGILFSSKLNGQNKKLNEFMDQIELSPFSKKYINLIEEFRIKTEIGKEEKKYKCNELKSKNEELISEVKKLSNLNEELSNLNEKLSNWIEELRGWIEEFNKITTAIFSSWRWRLGYSIGEISRKIRFKPHVPMAFEHQEKLYKRFRVWLKQYQADHDKVKIKKINTNYNVKVHVKDLNQVTIIVPIYNAYEEVCRCIKSLLKHTVIFKQILLIDDCSHDNRIWPLLQSYSERNPKIIAIRNDVNIGYTNTINNGCKIAENDIVLLNSDTEVTPNWLQKLYLTSKSAENIATVTPLSNAAGAFSIPENNVDNLLPKGITVEDMAHLVERLSFKLRPEVPTGNGFCMYVSKKALDKVGFFDHINFPRGYGEENDFCMRASKMGFMNLVEDSTFIYHKRSASFKNQKNEILSDSRQRLQELHPNYKKLITTWMNNDPLDKFRFQLKTTIDRKSIKLKGIHSFSNRRLRILYIMHNGQGGTLHTSIDLLEGISEKYNGILLQTDLKNWYLYETEGATLHLIAEYIFEKAWQIDIPLESERQQVIEHILSCYQPDLVHIRHLIANHPSLIHFIKGRNIPVVFSFHDFYTVCPTIQLINENNKYCQGECNRENSDCKCVSKWFKTMPPLKNKYIYPWREIMNQYLNLCDSFVVTSVTTKKILMHHYPSLEEDKFNIIEHGRRTTNYQFSSIPPSSSKPIKTVIFGALGNSKGIALVWDLLKINGKTGYPIDLYILGSADLPFVPDKYGCKYLGPYNRESLPEKLLEIKPSLAILPSIWPETFCHSLTEAWAAGIPVLGSSLGAVGERILKYGGGWILDPENPKKWFEKIIEIKESPAEYEKCIQRIRNMKFRNIEDMAKEYTSLYNNILSSED